MADIDYQAQAQAFAEFLLSLPKARRRIGDAVRGRCPKGDHEDAHPSFSYDSVKDCWACSCGAGKGSELRALLGWQSERAASMPHPPRASARAPIKPSNGLSMKNRTPDLIHLYANGNRKLRFYLEGGKKICAWEHLEGGNWIDKMKGDPGLYHEEMIALTDTIFLSESETDADALMDLGFIACSTPFGAQAAISAAQAKLFTGKTVLIFEHQDEAGKDFSTKCQTRLDAVGAESYIVQPPAPHKDIRDYLLAGGTKADIDRLVEAALPPQPKLISGADLEVLELGPIDWALFPIASCGALTLIHGNPKAGKSVFALYCALSMAKGIWMAGKFEIPKLRNVLYIAYEDNLRRIKERIVKYNTPFGLGCVPANIHFYEIPPTELALEDSATVAKLVRIVKNLKIDVLFVDTLSYAHRADENKSVEMQPVMASARKLCLEYNLAVVLLHHSRKSSAQGDDAPMISKVRGSGVIGAAPDHVLSWGNRVDKDVTRCQFESKDSPSGEWLVHYCRQTNGITFRVEDAEEESENVIAIKQKLLACVIELCKTSPEGVNRTTVAAVARCGKPNTVGNYLASMCGPNGPLIRHKSGSQGWMYHPASAEPSLQ